MTSIEKKQLIMAALSCYKRWLAEGKPEYLKQQYYYDGYHQGVWQREDGDYECGIQLSDSPEGDCWWYVHFRGLNGDTDIEILAESSEWR